MTNCSCQKTSSCSCKSASTSSCSCKSASTSSCKPASSSDCSCSTSIHKVIDPKTITPITSCEEASNKYSIETTIKARNGSGTQSNTRAGSATGDNTAAIVASAHAELVEVTVEIIRAVIGDTYGSTAVDASTAILTSLTDLATFQGYFTTGGHTDLPAVNTALTTTQIAYVNYITQAIYQVFRSIQTHIEGAESSLIICTSGNSRVFQASVKNCLFCLTYIYNQVIF